MSVDVTQVDDSSDKLLIRMKVHGEMKKKNGEEAIEFPYDLKTDKVEEVVGEMVSGLEEEEVVGSCRGNGEWIRGGGSCRGNGEWIRGGGGGKGYGGMS